LHDCDGTVASATYGRAVTLLRWRDLTLAERGAICLMSMLAPALVAIPLVSDTRTWVASVVIVLGLAMGYLYFRRTRRFRL
jgi:hypothetical protein